MGKLKNPSIKQTFCLIVIATAVVVILLSAASVRICSNVRDRILLPHAFIFSRPSFGRSRMESLRWKRAAPSQTVRLSSIQSGK